MRRKLGTATAVAIGLVAMAAPPAGAAEGWTLENVPPRENASSWLSSIASGEGATWAFGGWRMGKDPAVTQAFQRGDGGEWTEKPIPNVGTVKDSAFVSPTDVWVAGEGGDDPVVHWDGNAWTAAPFGADDQSASASGIANIDGEVWLSGTLSAVGQENQSLALRWDGQAWVDTDVPEDLLSYVDDIDGVAGDDVWAIGSTFVGGTEYDATALHWDGSAWAEVALPEGDFKLADVTAVAADDVWASGSRGIGEDVTPVVVHWDGTAWTEVPVADGNRGTLTEMAVINGEVWAVGDNYGGTNTNVLRYDGTTWQAVEGTPEGIANDIAGLPDGTPLLVGTHSTGPYTADPVAAVSAE